jgi:hypothetical protein
MSVAQLNECYDWMIKEAKKMAEEMKKEQLKVSMLKDPAGNYNPSLHSVVKR